MRRLQVREMQNNRRYSLLFVIGLMLSLGMASATFAADGDKKKKRPKNTGILSVTATPNALSVKVDGRLLGKGGVNGKAVEFYLTPGLHVLEIEFENGFTFKQRIKIVKNAKCLINVKLVRNRRPCPYDMVILIDGPEPVKEGDPVKFFVSNKVSDNPIPKGGLKYKWKISPEYKSYPNGLDSDAITVDTSGSGGKMLSVEVEVTDGKYDEICGQRIVRSTEIKGKKEP